MIHKKAPENSGAQAVEKVSVTLFQGVWGRSPHT